MIEQTTKLLSIDLTLISINNPHPPGEEKDVFFLLASKLIYSRNPAEKGLGLGTLGGFYLLVSIWEDHQYWIGKVGVLRI